MTNTRPKVLVVDDEALIRLNTCDMLDELGFVSVEAGTGEDALARLGQQPDIAVVIADLELPGMNGQELVSRARELRPDLRFVVATGHSADRIAGSELLAAITFLGKPFDLAALRRAIETCRGES